MRYTLKYLVQNRINHKITFLLQASMHLHFVQCEIFD